MLLVKTLSVLAVLLGVSTPALSLDPTCFTYWLVGFSIRHFELRFPQIDIPLLEHGSPVESMLTRHHIIPRTTLRPFFNEALASEHSRPRFVQFLRRLVTKARANNVEFRHDIDDTLNRIETLLPADGNAEFAGSVRQLWLLFCWMPFNFYLGPMAQLRSDEPGDVRRIRKQRRTHGRREIF